MKDHLITVDVYFNWRDRVPRYRVFVDGNLLTERDFTWGGRDIFIRENILVSLKPGPHNVAVEQVGSNGIMQAKNVTLDGTPSTFEFVTAE